MNRAALKLLNFIATNNTLDTLHLTTLYLHTMTSLQLEHKTLPAEDVPLAYKIEIEGKIFD